MSTLNNQPLPTDTDVLGAMAALKRAAKRAFEIAEATNTPCLVVKDGKRVNIARKQGVQTKAGVARMET